MKMDSYTETSTETCCEAWSGISNERGGGNLSKKKRKEKINK